MKMQKSAEQIHDSFSLDEARLKLIEQNAAEMDDSQQLNPARSITSKLVATQLNFISKTYRYEWNEMLRLCNVQTNLRRYGNESLQNIAICKKIDQHFDAPPTTLCIDPDIVKFANDQHEYEDLSNEAKIRLCVARIEVLHLQMQLERAALNTAQATVPREKIREIVCAICLEELHPAMRTIALLCGHVYCSGCLDKNTTNTCALCTMRNITLQSLELKLRFNLDYQPVCCFCFVPFTEESEMICLKCGHVFCKTCTNRLDGICFCGIQITAFDQMFTLFPTFN